MKIVVFDLDETLGYFTQFGVFWDSLANYLKAKERDDKLEQPEFDATFDLFPEYLRPNIINILSYLKTKKKSNCCNKMMIYTNNTGPSEWSKFIITYFERKISYKLIDQIIAAFKINGKRVEICRTTHNKTHGDFIKCTKVPIDTEICFIDDTRYPEMEHDNIYYINIKPYFHDLKFEIMLDRFVSSNVGKNILENDDVNEFKNIMMKYISLFKYIIVEKDEKEYEVDFILGKHIITHLNKFFSRNNKTMKNRGHRKNKTFKNH